MTDITMTTMVAKIAARLEKMEEAGYFAPPDRLQSITVDTTIRPTIMVAMAWRPRLAIQVDHIHIPVARGEIEAYTIGWPRSQEPLRLYLDSLTGDMTAAITWEDDTTTEELDDRIRMVVLDWLLDSDPSYIMTRRTRAIPLEARAQYGIKEVLVP